MALESASYISDLNSANPAPTDLIAQGDDHIRLIKAVLQATFPNINGAITLSDEDLNGLASLTATPFGLISAWYGDDADIPAGWAVCNGQTIAKSDGSGNITVPDLRDKVILGCGTLQPLEGGLHGAATQSATSAAGGSHTHSTTGSGAHKHTSITAAGTALTLSQIPAHTHTVPSGGAGGTAGSNFETGSGSATTNTSSVGSGAPHSHTVTHATADGTHDHVISTADAHTHGVTVSVYQPAMSLHYIMKI